MSYPLAAHAMAELGLEHDRLQPDARAQKHLAFPRFGSARLHAGRNADNVSHNLYDRSRLGRHRAAVWLLRYVAARCQHGHDNRDIPDGVPAANTQNHDARALHLKLDELLRRLGSARNRLIDLENCTDEEIEQIERQFRAFRARGGAEAGQWRRQVDLKSF